MSQFGFEGLDAWHFAIDFATHIYSVSKSFPVDERFGLTSQVRRAAVSVSANIAEGSGRGSGKDFGRFIEIAFGSLMESNSHLTIASRQGWIDAATYQDCYGQAERIGRMLSGLRRKLG